MLALSKTFNISVDGTSISEVQSGQFSSFGEYNSLVQLDFDTFVLANQGNNQNGFIKVYDILADGSFTEVNTLEHDTQNGAHNSLVQVDSNTFALAYEGEDNDGFIKTFTISSDGLTITEEATLEYDTQNGQYNSLVQVDSDTFALAYEGEDNDGFIKTFTISSDGLTITEEATLEYDTQNGLYNSLVQVDSNTFALAYQGGSLAGFIKTFTISSDGSLITEVGSLEHDTQNGLYNSLVQVDSNTFALAYQGGSLAGFIKTFTISSDGDTILLQSFDVTGINGGTIIRNEQGTSGNTSDDTLDYTPLTDFRGVDRFTYTISDGEDTDVGTVDVVVLGTNGRIVFTSDQTGDKEIYTMNIDGTLPINISDDSNAIDDKAAWSPDGTKIAFATDRDGGNLEIYTMDADGSNLLRLTDNTFSDTDPSWSPDGTQIVFASKIVAPGFDIVTMNAIDGSNQVNISNMNLHDDVEPDWSPDGTQIVFKSNRNGAGTNQIYTMDVDGSNQVNISNNTSGELTPSWSPDGTKIAFRSDRTGGNTIYTMDVDGSNQVALPLGTTLNREEPSWSPDGTKIALSGWNNISQEIFTINADGTSPVNLTNNVFVDRDPDWGTAPIVTNQAPESANDSVTTLEDTTYSFTGAEFAFTDVDAGDTLTSVQITTLESVGALKLGVDDVTLNQIIPTASLNTLVFEPVADENGSPYDSFGFSVNDGTEDSIAYTMTVNVTPVNDDPEAVDDSPTAILEGGSTAVDVTANDTDADGTIDDATVAAGVTAPQNGGIAIDPVTGVITYTHDGSETISDSFTYTVDDNLGATSNEATVTITITPVNDAPEAVDDNPTAILEGGFTAVDVTANDTDADGTIDDATVAAGVTAPQNGGIAIDPVTGVITYTHDGSETISDSFTYTVNDDSGATSNEATVTITITPVNDTPESANDSVTTLEDTTYSFTGAEFAFTDVDAGDTLTSVQITTLESVGALKLGVDDVTLNQIIPTASLNTLVFEPVADENGSPYDSFGFSVNDGTEDSIAYTMTVNVTPVNDDPEAVDDSPTAILEGGSTAVDVTANDTDADGTIDDATVAAGVTAPQNGGIAIDPVTGVITYTHDGSETISDSFTYTVNDDSGATSNEATVTITITPVNDAPEAVDDNPTAILEGGFTAVDVTANDTDADGTIDDATVAAGVTAPQNGGIAIDSDTGVITYTHDGSETISDSFTYTVNDDSGATSNEATVTITITPVNDTPESANDSVTTLEDTTYSFTGAEFAFTDVDAGDTLTSVQITTLESVGALKLGVDDVTLNQIIPTASLNTLVFEPVADENGSPYDSFGFSVNDGTEDSIAYTMTVNVTPVNDDPEAVDDSPTAILEGGSTAVDVTANDTDADGTIDDATVAAGVTAPQNGGIAIDPVTGVITYTHDGSETISDSFTYTVDDNLGATSNEATVTITITPVNDAPIVALAMDDQDATEDSPFSFTVPAETFTDEETLVLTLSATLDDDTALPGWLSFVPATGAFTGTPANGDTTPISVKVTAIDGDATPKSVSDTFDITITACQ